MVKKSYDKLNETDLKVEPLMPKKKFLNDQKEKKNADSEELLKSLSSLFESSMKEKPKRKKKVVTDEMKEKLKMNLQKGRETIKKNREMKKSQLTKVESKLEEKIEEKIKELPKEVVKELPKVEVKKEVKEEIKYLPSKVKVEPKPMRMICGDFTF